MEFDRYVEQSVQIAEEDKNPIVSIFVIDDLIERFSAVVDDKVLDPSRKM